MRPVSRALAALALALVVVPRPSRAQTVELYVPSDTALTIVVGGIGTTQLRVSNNCAGVSSYSITIFIDDSRVRLARADSVSYSGFPAPTVDTSVAGQVTLSATGSSFYCTTDLADLAFEMDAGAQEGSLFSLRVNDLVDASSNSLTGPSTRTRLLNVCQAIQIWGDVDSSFTVSSRDALVVLTYAVGLSVSGFDLTYADVDHDMQLTSRDALFILAAGIGLYTPSRAGNGIPNRCAPLEPVPADMVFWRSSSLYKVAAGDTTPADLGVVGTSSYAPTWSPDGARVAFTAFVSGYSNDILAVNSDGTGLDTLAVSVYSDRVPAWSPDGTRIAFISSQTSPVSAFIMNADGTNQTQLTTTLTVSEVAWSPDGTQLALIGYQTCCTNGLWTINADGTGLAEVFSLSSTHYPANPAWSPGSDSIAYYNGNWARISVVAASGGTAGVPASRLYGTQRYPSWISAGHGFRSEIQYPYDYFLRRASDGRHLRLTHGVTSYDYFATFARSGLVYVDAVSVSPMNPTVNVSQIQPLTATVTNSDLTTNTAVLIRWLSRDPSIASVVSTGTQTADVTGVAAGSVWIIATAGGWRTDSTQVTVP